MICVFNNKYNFTKCEGTLLYTVDVKHEVVWILLFWVLIILEGMTYLPQFFFLNCWLRCKVTGWLSCDVVQEQTKPKKHEPDDSVTAFVLYMNAS